MEKFTQSLRSRTTWTVIAMFLINGFTAVQGEISPDLQIVVNAVLSAVAVYFKINPSQEYTRKD